MQKYEFLYVFQISRKIIFEVKYYTLGSNQSPYFSTSACEFNQPKTDYNRCGQCQADLLDGLALDFYEKYDCFHLKDLDDSQWISITDDIEELKAKYNYIEEIRDTFKGENSNISFSRCKELSMRKLQ